MTKGKRQGAMGDMSRSGLRRWEQKSGTEPAVEVIIGGVSMNGGRKMDERRKDTKGSAAETSMVSLSDGFACRVSVAALLEVAELDKLVGVAVLALAEAIEEGVEVVEVVLCEVVVLTEKVRQADAGQFGCSRSPLLVCDLLPR